ncbi:hypothetical protein C8R48DRAFT_782923 [Suillus tomentosus]|nr:hypothetical protein C8R48DRAFT_782923 [Suillus tomentosus]
MMYPSATSYSDSEDTVLGPRINDDYLESEDSLFSGPRGQLQDNSDYPSDPFSDSGRLDPSAPVAQIQFNLDTQPHHHTLMQHQPPGGYYADSPSHLQPSSGPSQYPGAAAMQVPIFTPLSTFSDSHQGNYLPRARSSDLRLPGGTAPGIWAPPLLASSDQGNHWPSLVSSNLLPPGSMAQIHVPPPTLNNHHETLLPPFIVPSQNPIYLNDLAPLPPALADYRRNFPPPHLSMDGVTTIPPAAPDNTPPKPLTTLTHPQTRKRDRDSEWQFIGCSGQRQKKFQTSSLASSSTTPSYPAPTEPTQPHIDLPLLDYKSNLPIHESFVLAAEKQVISNAVNHCAMIKPSARESLIQVALADAVKHCLEKAHRDHLRSDHSAELAKKQIEEFGQRWAAKNAGQLYMSLSAPFKLIMTACKELAFSVVDRGYDLRPSLWSNTPESLWKLQKIKSLIDDATWPLKFIFKKDEETGEWMAFEHDAILDVVLGVVRKLKYLRYINDLDNLYCMAAAAIYFVFTQFSSGKVEFTAEAFKFIYDLLKGHITNVIEKDERLAKRWSGVKARTTIRLADIAA